MDSFGGVEAGPPGGQMAAEITAVQPVLMARDVGVSAAFYGRLGFAVVFQDHPTAPRYAVVRRGPVELHLQWADGGQWEHPGDRPAYRFPSPDVDALHAEFVASGGVGLAGRGPSDSSWGTREFHVRDPGGNVLQFYCPRPASEGGDAEPGAAADPAS
jgi:catechol 2,3-dioxygenase-like lactoylglutathione lyase family enzyme